MTSTNPSGQAWLRQPKRAGTALRWWPTALGLTVTIVWLLLPQIAHAQTVTTTFGYIGSEQTFVVPPGIASLSVVAIGGAGGENTNAAYGLGGEVSSPLTVTPGETLYVEVGGPGGTGSQTAAGSGGFNGGGTGGLPPAGPPYYGQQGGGGGGGASDIRTCSVSQSTCSGVSTLNTRLIVAAGGGGAAVTDSGYTIGIGQGGSAGQAAIYGELDGNLARAQGGGAGTNSSSGGQGGCGAGSAAPCDLAGGNGNLGVGGVGGLGAAEGGGGGGGGGYFGGGGGGGGYSDNRGDVGWGAGGGGGSDLVPTGGSATTTTAAPSISISYTVTASSVVVGLAPSSIVANGSSTSTATATVTDAFGNAVAGDSVSFSSSDPGVHFGGVTDHGDGTYTATVTSSTTVGSPTITATDSSVSPSVSGQATLAQTVGPATSVVVGLAPSSIVANGSSTSTATATVTDAEGHPIAGDAVSFSSTDSGDTIGSVTDHGNGTYTATITSSTAAHAVTITATDSSVSPHVSGQATLTQTPGPATSVSPAAQVEAALSQVLKPSGKGAKTEAILKAGGYSFSFTAPSAGKLVIDWYATQRGKHVLVASGSEVFYAARSGMVKLRLTAKGRKLLNGSKSKRLTTKASFTTSGGTMTTRTETFTVKR